MEKINKIHSELKGLYSQKADHRLKGILEVRKMLTPEQLRGCSIKEKVCPRIYISRTDGNSC